MNKKLFDTLVSDILSDSFFADYKFRRRDNRVLRRIDGEVIALELDHWRGAEECIIYPIYGKRFDILTKWFERHSFKALQDQRTNDDIFFGNRSFGYDETVEFKYDFSDYDKKLKPFLEMLKKNLSYVEHRYATLKDFYNEAVRPIINDEIELPVVGADWIFIDLTLSYIVDRQNYPIAKSKILNQVEFMKSRNEPNIERYYDRMGEIISDMENTFEDYTI